MNEEVPVKAETWGSHSVPEQVELLFLEGVSPTVKAVEAVIGELAQRDIPVLLLAEAGSGKRTVARRIHEASSRASEELHVARCSSLTPDAFAAGGSDSLFGLGTV